MLECSTIVSFDDAIYLLAWSHSFVLFIQLTFASVVLQFLVRFTSACHVSVHCLFVDKEHCVALAYFLHFVPIPSKGMAQSCCHSKGDFVNCFEMNVEWRGASVAPTPAHAKSGGVQPKPEPKHTHPRRTPEPGVAGCKQNAYTSTHQDWRGAAET